MAIGKTFKIINFKVLPQNGYFLAGGKGIFPQMCREKEKAARRKSFSNKDMMGIYLLSNLAGRWMSAKLYWEVDFDMGGARQENTALIWLSWE